MPKEQGLARRQRKGLFLTPDFLRKQRISLVTELTNWLAMYKVARKGIKIGESDEGRADLLERAFTYSERQKAIRRLEDCGKIISQIRRALDLVDNLLAGKRSAEKYGECIHCNMPISQKRLEALPWAGRCVSCQENEERER